MNELGYTKIYRTNELMIHVIAHKDCTRVYIPITILHQEG